MKTRIEIATETFQAVYNMPFGKGQDCPESTGNPSLGETVLTAESPLAGVVLSSILWDTDRGNWAWDGALAALRAAGINVDKPLG